MSIKTKNLTIFIHKTNPVILRNEASKNRAIAHQTKSVMLRYKASKIFYYTTAFLNRFKKRHIFIFAFLLCLLPLPSKAQEITPDGTTATEVNSADGSNFDINGGDKAGGNLFHSFGKFGVPTGGSANFLNSPDVENIINRVTGGSISNIDGLLNAAGGANLFLINPAGIVFGQNARLDIGGSFLGSTADSLLFSDGTEFSATNFQKPILTINAPIGLNFRDTPGDIVNRSQYQDGTGKNIGLQVQPGKNLTLVGGNVGFEGGFLTAPGGRVELGGLRVAGEVKFGENGNLTFPDGLDRGDVSLSNGTFVDVSSNTTGTAGKIDIQAREFSLTDEKTFLNASTYGKGNAGNINIIADGAVNLVGGDVFNNVEAGAVGNGGKITINAGELSLKDGAQLQTLVRTSDIQTNLPAGRGEAGNIDINVGGAVSLSGRGNNGFASGIFSYLGTSAEGKAGDININAGSLSIVDRAFINSSTYGIGDAGNIRINTDDSVSLDKSNIFSEVSSEAIGNGGNIDIAAKSLFLTNFANLDSLTFGTGNAGNVTVNASDTVSLDNGNIEANNLSADGNAGNIIINTRLLSLTNFSDLDSKSSGVGSAGNIAVNATDSIVLDNSDINTSNYLSRTEGNAGEINLNTKNLSLANSSSLTSETSGTGNGGNININTLDSVSLSNSRIESGISFFDAIGQGGNINITAGSLAVKDGSQIKSSTDGKGNAGNVTLNINGAVTFDGFDKFGLSSGVYSTVDILGVGNGGNIDVNAGSLSLSNGARIDSSTNGQGNSGNITLNISGAVTFEGFGEFVPSGVSSTVGFLDLGNGGNININAGSLSLSNGAQIDSSTNGTGNTGNITITANDTVNISSGARISNNVEVLAKGNSGEIKIDSPNLSLTDRGLILSITRGEGNAGDVNINARSIFLTGGSEILTLTQGNGKAGNISVNATDSFTISGFASLPEYPGVRAGFYPSGLASGSEDNALGEGGEISINTSKLSILNGGVLSARSRSDFKGGTVTINANNLELLGGGQIVTSAFKNGNSGDVNLNIKDRVSISGSDPTLFNRKEQLNSLFGNNQGDRTIDNVSPNSGIFANAISSDGGNINLTVGNGLFLRDGGKISAQVGGGGNGGNITVNAPNGFVVASPKQDNDIVATADKGKGGVITINATRVYGFDKKQIQSIADPSSLINNGENDINSTSANPQLSGSVRFNTDRIDPTQAINQLPVSILEPDNTVSQACSGSGDIAKENSFTIVGRGGMPDNPTKPLNSIAIAGSDKAEVQRSPDAEENNNSSLEESKSVNVIQSKTPIDSNDIIPARGMIVNKKGQVVLTRYPTPNASDRSLSQSNYCSDRTSLSGEENSTSKNTTSKGYTFSDNYLVGFN
jgi:filamentous hemagglutinin family protein